MVVFPRTSVALKMSGFDPVIGSPNIAILYNHGAEFERSQLRDEWDCCEYFMFNPQILQEILAVYDPAVQERPNRPFLFNRTTVNNAIFLQERKLAHLAHRSNLTPSIQIDEIALEVLESLVGYSYLERGERPKGKKATRKAHRQ